MILGLFGGFHRPEPEQNSDEWIEDCIPGYSDLPSADAIFSDGEWIEFDDEYFKQDDEYFELCRLRDEEVEGDDEIFSEDDFDTFEEQEDEPEIEDDDDFNFDDFLSPNWG